MALNRIEQAYAVISFRLLTYLGCSHDPGQLLVVVVHALVIYVVMVMVVVVFVGGVSP
jgi:hypothetical protein